MARAIGAMAAVLLGSLHASRADDLARTSSLGDAIAQGFEIKAQAVKANVLVISVQKGAKAYVCAANSDLVGRIFARKPVTAICVPIL